MATVAPGTRSTVFTTVSTTAGPFNIGFRLFDPDSLDVYLNGVRTTGFTISATFEDGYTDSATLTLAAAVASGTQVIIDGALTPRRDADYLPGDAALTANLNIELPRIWSALAEVKRDSERAVRGLVPIEASPEITVGLTVAAVSSAAAAATSAAQAALYDGFWLNTVTALLADTVLTYLPSTAASVTAGDYVLTRDGHRYIVAASGAADHHQITAGGVKLYVQSEAQGFNVRAFGAVANGITSVNSAVTAAQTAATSASASLVFPAGTYAVSANLTFTVPVRMEPGAVLTIATGATVAFNAGFDANKQRVFTLTGTASVTFDGATTTKGFPEWWGAVTGSAAAAAGNVTAINAALVALSHTELQGADYWVNGRVWMGLPNRTLTGAGQQYDGSTSNRITRIINSTATEHTLFIGPDTYPGSINALQRGNVVTDVYVGRAVAPSVPAGGNGVRIQYTLFTELTRVKSAESIYCFELFGTVHPKMIDCQAFRSVAGVGGADICRGFFINGTAAIPLNGGNASVYLVRCQAEMGGVLIDNSSGFYLTGRFTDCFIHQPETSLFAIGIDVQADAANTTLNFDNTNLQISDAILDTFRFAGILINGANKYGSIEISGGYYGAALGWASPAAILISNSRAQVNVHGGQFLMGVNAPTVGVVIENSSNVSLNRPIIMEVGTTGVALNNATNCEIKPVLKNHSVTGGAAVQLAGTCTANIISPMVCGKASAFTIGVQCVGTGDTRNEYQMTGIDSGAVSTGSGNKLVRNAVQITATGLSGTNLVSGVMT
jgi:hypothetical protein